MTPNVSGPTLMVHQDGEWHPVRGVSEVRITAHPAPEDRQPIPHWRPRIDLAQVRAQVRTILGGRP